MNNPFLVALMIVKDEEKNMNRCLDSITNFVDHTIIVDTGSTDKTIEIIKTYPRISLYHSPWRNDFSFHRNETIKYAEEMNYRWGFVIDGDEELAPMDVTPAEFKKRLTMLPNEVAALVVQVYEMRDGEPVLPMTGTRFFRAGRDFHYENIAHNRPRIEGQTGATDIVMYHYGYSNPDIMKKKWERTLPLLDERLKADPDDYNALFYRCINRIGLYDTQDGIESGIQDGIRCLELMPEHDPAKLGFYGKMYYTIGWAYLRINDPNNSYIWFKKGLEFYPDDVDLNFSLAQLGYVCMDDRLLKEYSSLYFKSLEKYRENLKPKVKGFATAMRREDMPIPIRHIHNATKKAEEVVKGWLEVEGL